MLRNHIAIGILKEVWEISLYYDNTLINNAKLSTHM